MTARPGFIAIANVAASFLAVAMLLLPCSAAVTQQKKECAGDVKKQCAGIQPGRGRITECIKSHFEDLSERCQTALLEVIGWACPDDVQKNCQGVRGRDRIKACMKTHLADVSELCKELLSQAAAGKCLGCREEPP